jgi:BolA protein
MSDRVAAIRQQLAVLEPEHVDIEDHSHLHAGHAGARDGGGHFAVLVVSRQFAGKSLLERHRMVYRALRHAMQADIHALSIKSYTPDEFSTPKQ